MKAALLAIALGAVVAVKAGDDAEQGPLLTPEDGGAAGGEAAPQVPAELSSLFGGLNQINWDAFSPEKLKMDLKYDEMSEEELQKVVSAFVSLGLIGQEEAERFARFIVDPELRDMLQRVSDNWSEVMQKIVSDPDYLRFLKDLQSRNLDEEKLATIVGLKHGLAGAVADAEAAMEEESAAAGEGSE